MRRRILTFFGYYPVAVIRTIGERVVNVEGKRVRTVVLGSKIW